MVISIRKVKSCPLKFWSNFSISFNNLNLGIWTDIGLQDKAITNCRKLFMPIPEEISHNSARWSNYLRIFNLWRLLFKFFNLLSYYLYLSSGLLTINRLFSLARHSNIPGALGAIFVEFWNFEWRLFLLNSIRLPIRRSYSKSWDDFWRIFEVIFPTLNVAYFLLLIDTKVIKRIAVLTFCRI